MKLSTIIIILLVFWIFTADASTETRKPASRPTLEAAFKAGLKQGRAERDEACSMGDLRMSRFNP